MRSWLVLAGLLGCSLESNYLDPAGPRFAGSHAGAAPAPAASLRVVSYNLQYGREVDRAIAALGQPPLAGADVILMQEMDPVGVDRIAAAHRLHWVYYPGSIKQGRDWGNAILSRWPLADDRKLLLPHADPYSNTRRIAVAARITVGSRALLVYSTHIATPALGLGARLDQIQTIVDDAGAATPVILAGDFNTGEPGSQRQVLDVMRSRRFVWASDSARDSGSRLGFAVTLDYVFARDLAASSSGTFAGDAGSDHQPVWAEFATP